VLLCSLDDSVHGSATDLALVFRISAGVVNDAIHKSPAAGVASIRVLIEVQIDAADSNVRATSVARSAPAQPGGPRRLAVAVLTIHLATFRRQSHSG
jgi:hypothetical protein